MNMFKKFKNISKVYNIFFLFRSKLFNKGNVK